VVDSVPPTITAIGRRISLWPPDHRMVPVTLADCVVQVTDACQGELDIMQVGTILRIESDEAEQAPGSGSTCRDIVLVGPNSAEVRAERIGNADGRVYTITFSATDAAGNVALATCEVEVTHDESGPPAVGGACAFCVGDGCGSCPGPDPLCK